MSNYIDEAQVEIATVDYFRELRYDYLHGPRIAMDSESPGWENHSQVVLVGRLRNALTRKVVGLNE